MDKGSHAPPRPSPDALLRAARREERHVGRLKIFLGAAPGVGKTYAMLMSARVRSKEGVDVVAAVVETHGRAETQALLAGIEVTPRRVVDYRTCVLDEMDLDAVLARRPALALVDELAHTNAEGSRHSKRYLDVEELLDAGIDVYTTLNVQHVESLNTVVAQITRIRVRETVPDRILDRADDIEAIDLAPEDLIQRLQDGKVYVPRQAERALRNFFSPGNLTALRELALRRTAQRVDAQLLAHMQSNAISGPWAAGERVLVCVGEGVDSTGLVRFAKRVADRLHAPATAIYIETGRSARIDESRRDDIAEAMRFAERLGIEALTIPGGAKRIAEDVLAYAHANNVTQIIVGKAKRPRWFEALNGSVVFDLVRHAGDISVHVMAVPEPESSNAAASRTRTARHLTLTPYAKAVSLVAAALGVAEVIQPAFGPQNTNLVFLTAVVGTAITTGLYPSLAAVLLSTLCYNFFFLPPLYTFTVTDPNNVAALFFFTTVAVLVSNLTSRVRSQVLISRGRARTTEALYSFSRKLAGCVGVDDVLWATTYQMASMLDVRVVILLPDADLLAVRAGYPPEDDLSDADLAAAQWTWSRNTPAGRGADTLPGAQRYFAPMRTGRGLIGVVGLDSDKSGPLLTPERQRLFDALLDQSALAIERVNLVADLDNARRLAEADKLRSALLTSISHDLRTPLASVLGSATTIRDLGGALDDDAKSGLVATIIEESERLNRFIANLLDMTKLESGAVRPNLTTVDAGEIIGTALARARRILANHTVEVDVAADLPMLDLDPVLFEQVLFNLLDNAAKYSDEGTTVRVRVKQTGEQVLLEILDEGLGIPADEVETVFEKFYRVRKGDRVRPGTGLGLAISRGFIEAMGGSIKAGNRTDRSGAVLALRLPVVSPTRTWIAAA